MLFSCFECWMVASFRQKFPEKNKILLTHMFGLMFTEMYLIAILAGFIGHFVKHATVFEPVSEGSMFYKGGFIAPFDVAIACLVFGAFLICIRLSENYGRKKQEAMAPPKFQPRNWEDDVCIVTTAANFGYNPQLDPLYKFRVKLQECRTLLGTQTVAALVHLKDGFGLLLSDRKLALLAIVISTFEGSMYAFIYNWTPALDSDLLPPPHGLIFSLFMMACMCGASMSSLISPWVIPGIRLFVAFGLALFSFILASIATDENSDEDLPVTMAAFLLFEFCVGMYFPSIGVLKSEVVPEDLRSTVYNIYRVPLNGIVVILLLSDVSSSFCFKLNAGLLVLGLGCLYMINSSSAQAPQGEYSAVSQTDQEMQKVSKDPEPVVYGWGGTAQPVVAESSVWQEPVAHPTGLKFYKPPRQKLREDPYEEERLRLSVRPGDIPHARPPDREPISLGEEW